MSIEIPLLHNNEWRPDFDRRRIPADQMAMFHHIAELLNHLLTYERRFFGAVFLRDSSSAEIFRLIQNAGQVDPNRPMDTLSTWMAIAARDAALTLYHFGTTIKAVRKSLGRCPALLVRTDHERIKEAEKTFHTSFPGHTQLRHAVSHRSDQAKSPEARSRNSARGPFKSAHATIDAGTEPVWLSGATLNSTYFVTNDGKSFHYDLTRKNGEKMRAIRYEIYSAFDEATIKKPAT